MSQELIKLSSVGDGPQNSAGNEAIPLRRIMPRLLIILFFLVLVSQNQAQADRFHCAEKIYLNALPHNKNGALSAGFGFEAGINYRLLGGMHVLAAGNWNFLSLHERNSDLRSGYVSENGALAGLKYEAPLGGSRFRYILSAAGLLTRLERSDVHGRVNLRSAFHPGAVFEAGVDSEVLNKLYLGVFSRYRVRPSDFLSEYGYSNLNMFSAGASLSWRF